MLLESYGVMVEIEGPCWHDRNQIIERQILDYEAILLLLGVDDNLTTFIVGVNPWGG